MKIVHVTDFYLPRLGGIEMQVSDLARRQAGMGHHVTVLTCSPAPPGTDGGPVRVVRLTESERTSALAGPATLRAAARWLPVDTDVVHVHVGVGSPLGFWMARTAARRGLPTLVTVHSVWWRVAPIFRILHRLGGWADLPVQWSAVSEVAAGPVRRLVGASDDVAVLGNGIDVGSWRVDRVDRAERTAESIVLVAVMRLAARKRALPMVDLLEQVRDRLDPGIDLDVVVVGDGPQLAAVQRRLARRGMDDWVHLTGRLDRDKIRGIFRWADVFLAPADLESFGIAALEAHCAGLPVVAKRAGGIGEFVVDGRTGLLAETDADLVDALVALSSDPQLRNAMTDRGVAGHVDWPQVLASTELLYDRAALRAGSVPRHLLARSRTA